MSSLVFELKFSEKGLQAIDIYETESQASYLIDNPFDKLNEKLGHHDVVLDIQGTSFQKKVWDEICRIPLGKTLSYKALAEKIGKPKAYRAVALACSQNTLVLIIPCHRVISSNRKISGYRFGQDLKKKLLAFEKKIKG
jgi:O-6-methylguanine DNA methyltransferase